MFIGSWAKQTNTNKIYKQIEEKNLKIKLNWWLTDGENSTKAL